jgi:hypothetical protein
VSDDETEWKLQPIRFLKASIFASGARETATNDTSRGDKSWYTRGAS